MKTRLLLFDIDGTLLGPCYPHGRAMLSAIESVYNVTADMRKIDPAGMTDKQIIIELLRAESRADADIDAKIAACMQLSKILFQESVNNSDIAVLSGVNKLLFAAHQHGHLLSLVTGNIEGIARKKMELANLGSYFRFGGFGCQHHVRAELVAIAMAKARNEYNFQGSNDNIFVIGDTVRDISAARENGVKVIAVSSGHTSAEVLGHHKPDFLFNSLEDTDAILSAVGI